MSALGDYVHLHYQNYQKYGIERGFMQLGDQKQKDDKQIFRNALTAQQEKTQAKINALQWDQTKADLVQMADSIKKNFNKAKSEYEQNNNGLRVEEQLLTKITDNFAQKISNLSQNNSSIIKSNKQVNFHITENSLKEAVKYRQRLLDQINEMNRGATSYIRVKNFNENLTKFFECLGVAANELKQIIDIQKFQGKLSDKDTTTALKELIQALPMSLAANSVMTGKMGESSVEWVKKVSKQTAVKKARQIGNQVSTFRVNLNNGLITPKIMASYVKNDKEMKAVKKETIKDNYANVILTPHTSQNKADVQLILENNMPPLYASVKAYKPASQNILQVSLQDVDLMYELLSFGANFSSHWLNLHASTTPVNASGRQQMDKEVTRSVSYQALSHGNLLKTNINDANIFILIDTATGDTFIKYPHKILTEDPQKNGIILSPTIQSIVFNNDMKSDWEERVGYALAQLHNNKIAVSFKLNMREGNKKAFDNKKNF